MAARRRLIRARLIVTVVYLATMLSLRLTDVADLLLFALYPIAAAPRGSYGRLLRRSLVALPFAAAVGLFNPIFDREPLRIAAEITVGRGWVTLFSILLRGMMSVQAVLLLIGQSGFLEVCRAMGRLGVPSIMTSQLLFVYRYIFVVTADSAALKRSVDSRRGSRGALPLKLWGVVIGQLLLRSLERAERIGAAMQARGFDGRFRQLRLRKWSGNDTAYTVALSLLFITVRVLHPSRLFVL
ncbi:MAG: energy-coupling factor transporter transmembrane component T [Tidjanibacter sp.]|nr:energy-coupling factor transporter transmembrane component T [Tidjanibacter sp.]